MNEEERSLTQKRNGRSLTFTIPDKTYMDLLIKIRHENLGWKRFFSFMIQGFLDDDPRIMEYIDLRMQDIRTKKRTKILQKERQKEKETIEIFGLDENEIDEMYDIFEEEVEP